MSLVPAKCPECGGNINVDGDKRLAICEFCKQPFVVEDAINNFNITYNITNHNEIKADVVNVQQEDINKKIDGLRLKYIRAKNNNKDIGKVLKEVYLLKENHLENIDVHTTYFDTFLDLYEWVFDKGEEVYCAEVDGLPPIKRLIDECDILTTLDLKIGEIYWNKLNDFSTRLYNFINKSSDYCDMLPEKEISEIIKRDFIPRFAGSGYSAWDRYMNNKYISIEDIVKNFTEELEMLIDHGFDIGKSILNVKNYLVDNKINNKLDPVMLVFGRLILIYISFNDDGNLRSYCKPMLISNSINTIDLVDRVKEYINQIKTEERRRKEQTYIEKCKSNNLCPICECKLSFLGKCKNDKCVGFGKKPFK